MPITDFIHNELLFSDVANFLKNPQWHSHIIAHILQNGHEIASGKVIKCFQTVLHQSYTIVLRMQDTHQIKYSINKDTLEHHFHDKQFTFKPINEYIILKNTRFTTPDILHIDIFNSHEKPHPEMHGVFQAIAGHAHKSSDSKLLARLATISKVHGMFADNLKHKHSDLLKVANVLHTALQHALTSFPLGHNQWYTILTVSFVSKSGQHPYLSFGQFNFLLDPFHDRTWTFDMEPDKNENGPGNQPVFVDTKLPVDPRTWSVDHLTRTLAQSDPDAYRFLIEDFTQAYNEKVHLLCTRHKELNPLHHLSHQMSIDVRIGTSPQPSVHGQHSGLHHLRIPLLALKYSPAPENNINRHILHGSNVSMKATKTHIDTLMASPHLAPSQQITKILGLNPPHCIQSSLRTVKVIKN